MVFVGGVDVDRSGVADLRRVIAQPEYFDIEVAIGGLRQIGHADIQPFGADGLLGGEHVKAGLGVRVIGEKSASRADGRPI